ncbi:MAG: hypothetical protein KF696_11345 [Planctomycetes bacterium]|nr:hypothetical protein [Planctomycetota bacterium]MCW8135753.1 hypothetical protein [Planctomycetota bacterium]
MQKAPALSSYTLPDEQRRRGSFVVRMMLRRVSLRQHPAALKAAARVLLVLPLLQGALLVGVLNAEYWLLLLCAEGLLIALLASSQLSRPTAESRLIGYGIGVLNIGAVAAVGAFLGVPLLWITGMIAMLPFSWLVLRPTGANTIKAGWAMFALPMLLLAAFAGFGRLSLEQSRTEQDPAARASQLHAAFDGMRLRGFNATERALLRLRQAQAAYQAGDYERAFEFASDGMQYPSGELRGIPKSPIGQDLLESLIRIKAQAFYNARWGKTGEMSTLIPQGQLSHEELSHEHARVRWGW